MSSCLDAEIELELLQKKNKKYLKEAFSAAKKCFKDPEAARRERNRIWRHSKALVYRAIELDGGER